MTKLAINNLTSIKTIKKKFISGCKFIYDWLYNERDTGRRNFDINDLSKETKFMQYYADLKQNQLSDENNTRFKPRQIALITEFFRQKISYDEMAENTAIKFTERVIWLKNFGNVN